MFKDFNASDTLGIISSYPALGGELARGNAISRYTYLLTKSFPKTQQVVVFCEVRNRKTPYLVGENILVVPTYKLNSLGFLGSLLTKISMFNKIGNYLVEFEFSIFGGKVVIPQILALTFILRLFGKSIKVMFHQVICDINLLYGHLAIKKNGFKAWVLNVFLKLFYTSFGFLSDKVFVHDRVLGERISKFVNASKVRIIPHGIEAKDAGTLLAIKKAKSYFGVKNGTKLVGIFGYCSWYKGTDWLIENFARFAGEHKEQKVRLLVAGGESPTLKGTLAYAKYHKKLKKVIKEANGNIIYTGFVPDRDVEKIFRAVDLFIFPYRTKMSASGAFSLCLGYQKPYIVSSSFSENISKVEARGRVFDLNYRDFEKMLMAKLKKEDRDLSFTNASWEEASDLYLKESLSEQTNVSKLRGYGLLSNKAFQIEGVK